MSSSHCFFNCNYKSKTCKITELNVFYEPFNDCNNPLWGGGASSFCRGNQNHRKTPALKFVLCMKGVYVTDVWRYSNIKPFL